MAAPGIGLRRAWAPPPTAKVDWSHPLAPGCGWIPSMGMRSIHGEPCTTIDAARPLPQVMKWGKGMDVYTPGGGGTPRGVGWPNRIRGTLNNVSFVWAGFQSFYVDGGAVIATRGSGINATGLDAFPRVRWDDDSATWGFDPSPALANPDNNYRVIVGVVTPAGFTVYVDGVTYPVPSYSPPALNFSNLSGATAWRTRDDYGSDEGYCAAAYIYPRSLAPREVRSITADPYQFMRR